MTTHELAKRLLLAPNVPVGYERDGVVVEVIGLSVGEFPLMGPSGSTIPVGHGYPESVPTVLLYDHDVISCGFTLTM